MTLESSHDTGVEKSRSERLKSLSGVVGDSLVKGDDEQLSIREQYEVLPRLPMGEYVTDNLQYELTDPVTDTEQKWRGGKYLKEVIQDSLIVFESSDQVFSSATLLPDFPGGHIMMSINSGMRGDKRFFIVSFQRPNTKVNNYEFLVENKIPDLNELQLIDRILSDIVKKETAFWKAKRVA